MYKFIKLITTRKVFPYGLSERLVYSYLLYAARKTRSLTVQTLAARTRLCRNTVTKAIKNLQLSGLVCPGDPGWMACHPSGENKNWFRFPAKLAGGPWYDRFMYLKFFVANDTNPMTLKQIHLFSLLVSLADSEFGVKTSIRHLASLLNADRKTVRKHLALLAGHELVTLVPQMVVKDGHPEWWAKQFKTKKATKYKESWEVAMMTCSEDQKLAHMMYNVGRYSVPEVNKVLDLMEYVPLSMTQELYRDAQNQHHKEGSSARLLMWKMKQYIKRKQR